MQRTQIYLPEDLRKEIDKARSRKGQSLSDYIRNASEERVKKDKKEQADLEKLANEFIGCSTRTDAEIQEWLDWIQEEKRLVDEKIDARWEEARKK